MSTSTADVWTDEREIRVGNEVDIYMRRRVDGDPAHWAVSFWPIDTTHTDYPGFIKSSAESDIPADAEGVEAWAREYWRNHG